MQRKKSIFTSSSCSCFVHCPLSSVPLPLDIVPSRRLVSDSIPGAPPPRISTPTHPRPTYTHSARSAGLHRSVGVEEGGAKWRREAESFATNWTCATTPPTSPPSPQSTQRSQYLTGWVGIQSLDGVRTKRMYYTE
jgi:hypothetical protein